MKNILVLNKYIIFLCLLSLNYSCLDNLHEVSKNNKEFVTEKRSVNDLTVKNYLLNLTKSGELKFDEILNFEYSFVRYGDQEYLQIEVKVIKNGKNEAFIAFPNYTFEENIIALSATGGCIMNCITDRCSNCRQTINEPCKSQTCACSSGDGGCSAQTVFTM